MNTIQRLESLRTLLKKSKHPYATECLSQINEGKVHFFQETTLETLQAYNTYRVRCDMQRKQITKGSFDGYDALLHSLAEAKEPKILCINVKTIQATHIVFTTTDIRRLKGILRCVSKGSDSVSHHLSEQNY